MMDDMTTTSNAVCAQCTNPFHGSIWHDVDMRMFCSQECLEAFHGAIDWRKDLVSDLQRQLAEARETISEFESRALFEQQLREAVQAELRVAEEQSERLTTELKETQDALDEQAKEGAFWNNEYAKLKDANERKRKLLHQLFALHQYHEGNHELRDAIAAELKEADHADD